jgi:hypothetical protein
LVNGQALIEIGAETLPRAQISSTAIDEPPHGRNAANWGWLGTALGVLFMLLVHTFAAATLYFAVLTGERMAVEQSGKIVVSRAFLNTMNSMETQLTRLHIPREAVQQNVYDSEAQDIVRTSGGSKVEIARKLRDAYLAHGTADFITKRSARPGFRLFARKRWQRLPAVLGSLVLLWWALMLTFQGEGLELDLQQPRHPMWE